MILAQLAALGAAVCWASSSLISVSPAKRMGAMAFVRWRMSFVAVILVLLLIAQGRLHTALLSIPAEHITGLVVSGLIGIWIGDVLLFMGMRRLGPRRTAILFSTNAPMQVLLGLLFLNEDLSFLTGIGCFLVIFGTYLAIVFGKRPSQIHEWENITGLLIVGILIGLGAALGQAVGALIAKPIMDTGVSPIGATIIRVAAAAAVLWLGLVLPINQKTMRIQGSMTPYLWFLTLLSGFVGMALGMTLLLYALASGRLGVVAVLSSISPVLMLPMLWYKTKERPALGAWIGAITVVLGIVSISFG